MQEIKLNNLRIIANKLHDRQILLILQCTTRKCGIPLGYSSLFKQISSFYTKHSVEFHHPFSILLSNLSTEPPFKDRLYSRVLATTPDLKSQLLLYPSKRERHEEIVETLSLKPRMPSTEQANKPATPACLPLV